LLEGNIVGGKDGEQSTVRPSIISMLMVQNAVDHRAKVLEEDHGFTMDQAKHVSFHTPKPKVLKALAKHYNITEKLSWLPNNVATNVIIDYTSLE
jgi:3-hydroxy-3-methylglutaryl CoA synthase